MTNPLIYPVIYNKRNDTYYHSEIFLATIEAVKEILWALMPWRDNRQPLRPDVISTPNEFRAKLEESGKQSLPAMGIKMETMRRYLTDKNQQALRHLRGKTVRMPDRTTTVHNLSAIESDFNVFYWDDDERSLIQFCQNWLHELEYSIDLQNSDIGVGVHLSLGDTLNAPQRNVGEAGDTYNFESGIVVKSYIGMVRRVPTVKAISISDNIVNLETKEILKDWTILININYDGTRNITKVS